MHDASSGADALRQRFAGPHRVLSGKYFVDEAYDRVIAQPLYWISDRVFLQLGDRKILDGSLPVRNLPEAFKDGLNQRLDRKSVV